MRILHSFINDVFIIKLTDVNYDGIDDKVVTTNDTNTVTTKIVDLDNDGTVDYIKKETKVTNNGTGTKIELDFNNDSVFDESELIVKDNSNSNYIIREFKQDNKNLFGTDVIDVSVPINKVDTLVNVEYNNFKEITSDLSLPETDHNITYTDSNNTLKTIGLDNDLFKKIDVKKGEFESFYSKFLALYDSSAQEAAKNNLRKFFTNNPGNNTVNNTHDSIKLFNYIKANTDSLDELAKIINFTYNISASFIINESNERERVFKDFFKKIFIVFSLKYPDESGNLANLSDFDTMTIIILILQLYFNFKKEYNFFVSFFFKLLDYIVNARALTEIKKDDASNYSVTDNIILTFEVLSNYYQNNTIFDLARLMRTNGLDKFRPFFIDSDNDKMGDFADTMPNDNRGVKIVKTIKYYTHKTRNTIPKYVKKVVTNF